MMSITQNLDPKVLANLSESYVAELFLNGDSDFSKEANLLLFDMAQPYVISSKQNCSRRANVYTQTKQNTHTKQDKHLFVHNFGISYFFS